MRILHDALKQLGIIIVTYQSERYVVPLLQSLAATLDPRETEIWILDNASTDATTSLIEQEIPAFPLKIHLIRSEKNVGFMRGNNLAYAEMQRETPCANIILLNPDTVVHQGWWRPLLAALDAPDVGTAVSLLLLPDGRINSRGNSLHFLGLGFVQGYGESTTHLPAHPTLFSGSGAALAFRASTLENLNGRQGLTGIFWEELFLYADDTDLGWRMRLAGLDNRIAFESRVTHDHRFWLQGLDFASDRLFLVERNRFLLLLANFKWPTLALLVPWIVASEIALGLRLWKLYPNRVQLWRSVWHMISTGTFWSRRRRIQAGRSATDRAILQAMTGSIRHGALPFRPVDRLLDAALRASHALLCFVVRW